MKEFSGNKVEAADRV